MGAWVHGFRVVRAYRVPMRTWRRYNLLRLLLRTPPPPPLLLTKLGAPPLLHTKLLTTSYYHYIPWPDADMEAPK